MSSDELNGTYMRLRQELVEAYGAEIWNEGRINRLANEIALVEQALTKIQPATETIGDGPLRSLP